ncbi:MAG TPA: SPOR domain-containing protein [Stellaceae bacterium]|nr:SPOR domain-containing protein [Stellaceae bacterium]
MSYQQFGHVDREDRIEFADEPPANDEPPPRRLLPGAALAVGVMALFAGGLWFAYHEGAKHAASGAAAPDGVPLIRADTDPVKVKPDKAGGMDIPDKDNPLYTVRPGAAPAEHILPPPEAPAPRSAAPPQVATASPSAAPAPAPAPAASAPRQPPALTPQQVAALAKPPAKPSEPAAKPTATAGGLRIQLASLRTPDEAREEWARLKRANADLLGRMTAVAVKADMGERGIYYRVEAGPLADRDAALRLCRQLKERGLGCSLVP